MSQAVMGLWFSCPDVKRETKPSSFAWSRIVMLAQQKGQSVGILDVTAASKSNGSSSSCARCRTAICHTE